MIQIIGFLICACLAIKLLEMSAHPSLHDLEAKGRDMLIAAQFVGWASVFGFAFWLFMQGNAFPQ